MCCNDTHGFAAYFSGGGTATIMYADATSSMVMQISYGPAYAKGRQDGGLLLNAVGDVASLDYKVACAKPEATYADVPKKSSYQMGIPSQQSSLQKLMYASETSQSNRGFANKPSPSIPKPSSLADIMVGYANQKQSKHSAQPNLVSKVYAPANVQQPVTAYATQETKENQSQEGQYSPSTHASEKTRVSTNGKRHDDVALPFFYQHPQLKQQKENVSTNYKTPKHSAKEMSVADAQRYIIGNMFDELKKQDSKTTYGGQLSIPKLDTYALPNNKQQKNLAVPYSSGTTTLDTTTKNIMYDATKQLPSQQKELPAVTLNKPFQDYSTIKRSSTDLLEKIAGRREELGIRPKPLALPLKRNLVNDVPYFRELPQLQPIPVHNYN